MSVQFEYFGRCDLQHPLAMDKMLGVMFTQDNLANRVGVEVFDGGAAATLGGTITYYIITPAGNTVTGTGSKSGNRAWVDIPTSAYAHVGVITIILKHIQNDTRTTIFAGSTYVAASQSGQSIDPGSVVPDLTTLLAKIQLMEEATDDANAAADNANAAASNIADEMDALKSALSYYDELAVGIEDIESSASWESGTIDDSGTETVNANMIRSSLIPVDAGTYKFLIKNVPASTWIRIHKYNSSQQWTSMLSKEAPSANTLYKKSIEVQSGYIRIAMAKSNTLLSLFNAPSSIEKRVSDLESIGNIIYDVTGTTRNIFAGGYIAGFINASTNKIAANANGVVVYAPCEGGKTYTVSKQAGTRFIVGTTTGVPVVGNDVANVASNATASRITLTASPGAAYIVAFVYLSTSDTGITKEEMLATVQIEEGSSATDYIPHLTAVDQVAREEAKSAAVEDDLSNFKDGIDIRQIPVTLKRGKRVQKTGSGSTFTETDEAAFMAVEFLRVPTNTDLTVSLIGDNLKAYAWCTTVSALNDDSGSYAILSNNGWQTGVFTVNCRYEYLVISITTSSGGLRADNGVKISYETEPVYALKSSVDELAKMDAQGHYRILPRWKEGALDAQGAEYYAAGRYITVDYLPTENLVSVVNNSGVNGYVDYYNYSNGAYTFTEYAAVQNGATHGIDTAKGTHIRIYVVFNAVTDNVVVTAESAAIAGVYTSLEHMLAPVEASNTATQAYAIGALLIVNHVLYKVTAAIAVGDTITPGTNVRTTTLSELIT